MFWQVDGSKFSFYRIKIILENTPDENHLFYYKIWGNLLPPPRG